MAWLNLACFMECTEAEGPGRRFAIWTQGCLLRCAECCNQQFQPLRPAHIISSDELFNRICTSREENNIEGITLLGGEPFLQAAGLAQVARRTQEAGLSVMCFTGYDYSWLKSRCDFKGTRELLEHIDVLVDGPYLRNKSEQVRNWAGSTNQNFIYLTDFYTSEIETRPQIVSCEWRIGADGTITVNGYPADIPLSAPPDQS